MVRVNPKRRAGGYFGVAGLVLEGSAEASFAGYGSAGEQPEQRGMPKGFVPGYRDLRSNGSSPFDVGAFVKMRGRALIGICFWGGVLEGVAEEIGEKRKGVVPIRLALGGGVP